jgi:hypothetical protein
VAIGGSLLGGTARLFRGEKFFSAQKPWVRTGNKKKQKRDIRAIDNKVEHDDFMWNILSSIDEALLEIDFDISECAQRFVCWHVKNSLLNMQENRANNIDKFLVSFIK